MATATRQAAYLEDHVINSFAECQQPSDRSRVADASKPKCPRGRPPVGAVLGENGTYILPPAAVEAAAERVIKHRNACRERYVATRKGLRVAKAELFAKRPWSANQQLSSQSKERER